MAEVRPAAAAMGNVNPEHNWPGGTTATPQALGQVPDTGRCRKLHAKEAPGPGLGKLEAWGAVFDPDQDGKIQIPAELSGGQ